MNKKAALIKSLLKGDTINVSNSIKYTGYSNPSREISRQIEKPFNCIVTRTKIESKDQWGNYVTWYNYKLNKSIGKNEIAIKKMKQYVAENNK